MADNYAKYAISKTTLDSIAAQTMTLSGTDAAMTTNQIRQAVVDANVEVAAQAQKIAAISDVLTEKGSESSEVGDNATTPIKQNTNDLDALFAKAQALPDKVVLQEKTVTPSTSVQDVLPDNGYNAMSKVTVNAMPTATQATPSIEVSSSGLITASATQSAGYVASGTQSATKQLTTKAAATITPGTSNQTIASGTYLTGTQTIKGDSNLKAANIKSGTTIFGVPGSLTDIASNMANFYGFTKANSGSFTLSSLQTANYTVTHNLGSVPKLVMLYPENAGAISNTSHRALGGVMAFQTTSQTQVSQAPTSSGVYMLTALYYNSNEVFGVFLGVAATSTIGYNGTANTMLNTANNNTAGKTPITSLTNSSFIIPYASSYYMSTGTFKWLVMG